MAEKKYANREPSTEKSDTEKVGSKKDAGNCPRSADEGEHACAMPTTSTRCGDDEAVCEWQMNE